MSDFAKCPNCGASDLDLCDFESMIMVDKDTAVFTLRCPHCDHVFSAMHSIPARLNDMVHLSAVEVDAGMGEQ